MMRSVGKKEFRVGAVHYLDMISKLLDQFWAGQPCPKFEKAWYPPIATDETNGLITVTALLAGFKPEDLEVVIEGNILTIGSERGSSPGTQEVPYDDARASDVGFCRVITLNRTVDAEKVTADFSDGALTVKLPKVDGPGRKRIEVHGNGQR